MSMIITEDKVPQSIQMEGVQLLNAGECYLFLFGNVLG